MTQPIDNNLKRLKAIHKALSDFKEHKHESCVNKALKLVEEGCREEIYIQRRVDVNARAGL